MNKQEILDKFNKQLKIKNFSEQTIKNYLSALKLFLKYVKNLNIKKITDK